MDAATDAEIARLLAEDQGFYYEEFGREAQSDSDSDYGSSKKKKAKKTASKKAIDNSNDGELNAVGDGNGVGTSDAGPAGPGGDESHAAGAAAVASEFTATGRRKRKDTGAQRTASRSWSEDEERLFLEALAIYGRDWKKCAEHVSSRDARAIASHSQKFLIKALIRGEELPGRMAESGRGYTLSGKPLDPNSAAARAYGLRVDAFKKVVDSGFLLEGVHVTTLEMTDGVPPRRQTKSELAARDQPATAKCPRRNATRSPGSTTASAASRGDGQFGAVAAAEPTEYAKNRPRRQVASAMAHLGDTTESLDLTHPANFVGPPGSGAPLAQPFSVSMSSEAMLVMDFHAHLSCCEIIGLLGGTFDAQGRKLTITAAYPCRRTVGSDSSTSVELDAESQVEVTCEMDNQGLIPVGWYHSHPVFEPRPSVKDNENQRNYQALCRDQVTGLEPWVGAIVGPYGETLPSSASQTQLWMVRQQGKDLTPYNVRGQKMQVTESFPSDAVHNQLALALAQLKDDVGRINVHDTWRSCSRLIQGHPEGPPMTFADKIRGALRAHLPRDKPDDEAAFFSRLESHFREQWGVEALLCSGSRRELQTGEAGSPPGATGNGTLPPRGPEPEIRSPAAATSAEIEEKASPLDPSGSAEQVNPNACVPLLKDR